MKSIVKVQKWLIKHRTDEEGDLDLSELDFTGIEGDVDISGMKVNGRLHQGYHNVKGDISQSNHKVTGSLFQGSNRVGGNVHQGHNEIGGDLHQEFQKVGGDLEQWGQRVKGYAYIGNNTFNGIKTPKTKKSGIYIGHGWNTYREIKAEEKPDPYKFMSRDALIKRLKELEGEE